MAPFDSSRFTRRRFLQTTFIAGGLSAMGKLPALAENTSSITLPFERGERPLVAFPEKRPLMVMTTRPPQLGQRIVHFLNELYFCRRSGESSVSPQSG